MPVTHLDVLFSLLLPGLMGLQPRSSILFGCISPLLEFETDVAWNIDHEDDDDGDDDEGDNDGLDIMCFVGHFVRFLIGIWVSRMVICG